MLSHRYFVAAVMQVVEAQQFGKDAIDVIFAEAERMEKVRPGDRLGLVSVCVCGGGGWQGVCIVESLSHRL
jgi:hypothetical protein